MKRISKRFNRFGFSLLLLAMFLFAGALPVSARIYGGWGGRSSPSSGKTVGTYAVGTNPQGIAIDSSGNVWVANNGSGNGSGSNVTELNSFGATVGTYAAGAGPNGIAIDSSGNVWVTNSGSNTVTVIKPAKGPVIGPHGPHFHHYSGPRWLKPL